MHQIRLSITSWGKIGRYFVVETGVKQGCILLFILVLEWVMWWPKRMQHTWYSVESPSNIRRSWLRGRHLYSRTMQKHLEGSNPPQPPFPPRSSHISFFHTKINSNTKYHFKWGVVFFLNQSLGWNPQGERKKGRPKSTWELTVIDEAIMLEAKNEQKYTCFVNDDTSE